MKLVVDGEIWQRQAAGGISRLFNEVLPRVCDLAPDLALTIVTDGQLKGPVPTHRSITQAALPAYHKFLRPGRLWQGPTARLKRATRNWWTKPARNSIWQATYYSSPAAWPGRFVVVVYDLIEERFPQLFDQPRHDAVRRAKHASVHAADLVLCISRTTQRDVCDFLSVPEAKTRPITLASSPIFRRLSADELAASLPLLSPAPFFLYLGDRSAYKNFDLLARAFAAWPHRHEFALAVVGPKFVAAEQLLLSDLGIAGQVFSYQNIDDETLCRFYNLAQAFVYPSLYEGFGIPLLEAMSCGCPVVASAIPTTQDVAGELPFYFEPTDAAGLQAALSAALATDARAERGRAGIERAAAFSWDATAAQFLAVYRELEAWAR